MKRGVTVVLLVAALAVSAGATSQDVSAVPPRPTTFAAPPDDPAGRVAREIASFVPHLPNLRAMAHLGQWRLDDRARWSIRSERECLEDLASQGVEAEPFATSVTPIPTPVRVLSEIGGVRYRKRRAAAVFVVSCELAARMTHLSAILREHGIDTVDVSSSWRRTPMTSFHRMGLALDILAFRGPEVEWVVERDYAADLRHATCPAPPDAPLQALACELGESGWFSTVITPSYSPGHRDHFHVDMRPDDARVFVR